MRVRGGGLLLSVLAVVIGLLTAPGAAGAATVVNGGFEAGNLSGWHKAEELGTGDWFAYRGTESPYGAKRGQSAKPVQAPPQGRFAAITDEVSAETLTLWQDVALEPNETHTLSLQAFYQSELPLALPTPDVLSASEEALGEQPNIQFRIDVMKPSAPLNSLAPEDILATLFQTGSGSPEQMAATRFSANLSAFAGQTVRIRAIAVDRPDPNRTQVGQATEGVFNAGIDNVVINSAPGVARGSSQEVAGRKLSFGRVHRNPKNGHAILQVNLPVAGLLTIAGVHAKGKPSMVTATRKQFAGPTIANMVIKPTRAGRAMLAQNHRLRVNLTVLFKTDDGFESAPTTKHLTLQLVRPEKRRR